MSAIWVRNGWGMEVKGVYVTNGGGRLVLGVWVVLVLYMGMGNGN